MMSKEMLAGFVDGTLTDEQRDVVRRYLCDHPEELESLLHLIDKDKTDYLGECTDDSIENEPPRLAVMTGAVSNILGMFSAAAALVSMHNFRHTTPRTRQSAPVPRRNRMEGFNDRLSQLCDEIEKM